MARHDWPSTPDDLGFFARHGAVCWPPGRRRTNAPQFLLELAGRADCWMGRRWDARLESPRESPGCSFLDPAEVHCCRSWITLADSSLHAGCPEPGGPRSTRWALQRAIEDTAKDLVQGQTRLRSLMQFENGSYVWMKDKGPGRSGRGQSRARELQVGAHGSARRCGSGSPPRPRCCSPLDASHIETAQAGGSRGAPRAQRAAIRANSSCSPSCRAIRSCADRG